MSGPIVVLGAGPAGLAVARQADRRGIPVALFEREPEVGGMCRTFRCGPHGYDAGAHRFHDQDPRTTDEVRALLGPRLVAVDAPSLILDGRRFVPFPPTPLAMLTSGGLSQVGRIALDLVRSRVTRGPATHFEALAIGRFGETLARRFLINYSEKLWGLPARELSPEIATRRLGGMTLRSLLIELVAPRRRVDHIDGGFLYPTGGYGELCAALAGALSPAAQVHTGCEATALDVEGGRVVRVRFAERPALPVTDRLVATIPLPTLVRLLGDAVPAATRRAAQGLRFRGLRLVFLRLARPRVAEAASIYLPDPALCVARVSEPKNRSAALAPAHETGLLAEIPCFPGDALAQLPDEALAARVISELAGVGLVRPHEVLEWRHHLLSAAYPVYALGYRDAVEETMAGLRCVENLVPFGRGGRFWYSHLHDQLRLARELVESW